MTYIYISHNLYELIFLIITRITILVKLICTNNIRTYAHCAHRPCRYPGYKVVNALTTTIVANGA